MNALKFFNVYRGSHLATLHKENPWVETNPDYADMPSTEHRTVTGPYDNVDEAREAYQRRGAKDYFIKTIGVPFNL